MKQTLKRIFFVAVFSLCASFTAFAQRQDDSNRQPPPKEKPPVVVVPANKEKPKEDKKDDRRDDNRRKPQAFGLSEMQFVDTVFD